MKKSRIIISLFLFLLSSLFFIRGIYGYLTDNTPPTTNMFSVKDTTSYTVIHRQMDLNGTTYTVVSETDYEVPLGTTVTPPVNTYTGFISPQPQTETFNTYAHGLITYSYDREQYHLTINNSDYVTVSPASATGNYLYGTEITLFADSFDNNNNPFIKWSNNVTTASYTFTITGDTTIGPLYEALYEVTFQYNNGDPATTTLVVPNTSLATLPSNLTYDDCQTTQGSYADRGCTYYHSFEGWYTEPTFVNEVNDGYVPTGDTTLYAKWNKIYYHLDSHTFDNTHLVDTGISLFNSENASKDFEVSFIVTSTNSLDTRDVIFANMYEVKDPYQGVNFRWFENNFNINVNVVKSTKKNDPVDYQVGDKVILKRENNLFYYSIDGGNNFIQYNDFTGFTGYFDVTATFGGNYDANGVPWRFFNGTLTDMTVEIIGPDNYTIYFDANGGTGMMLKQKVLLGTTVNLSTNQFSKQDCVFLGWNTEPDGSGTSYSDGEQITDIANVGDTLVLYAMWKLPDYYVHFDANGGTGTIDDEPFMFDEAKILNSNTFTKTGYIFGKWNTEPDGSGTSYEDNELVTNVTNIQDDTITLYAMYEKIEYEYNGTAVFNGTSNYINTGVNPYTEDTLDKDFDIIFTVESVGTQTTDMEQPTIISCKDETYNNVWPGFVVRLNTNESHQFKPSSRWGSSVNNSLQNIQSNKAPVTFRFKRRDGVVTMTYTMNNGTKKGPIEMYDQGDWTLDRYFPDPITFGASIKNGTPWRFFNGEISNMQISIAE